MTGITKLRVGDEDFLVASMIERCPKSMMLRELVNVVWGDLTESVPAALCALAMPFTYSIANGLAFGFIAYAALKAGTGRWREGSWWCSSRTSSPRPSWSWSCSGIAPARWGRRGAG